MDKFTKDTTKSLDRTLLSKRLKDKILKVTYFITLGKFMELL